MAFPRRQLDGENGETFKIKAVKPLDELRKPAVAAKPPIEKGKLRKPDPKDFDVYEAQWWHFDYRAWREYPILNLTFERLVQ